MTDLTVNLYNKFNVCHDNSLTLLETDNFLLAFKQTSFIWTPQSRLDVKNNPKCLWVLTQ